MNSFAKKFNAIVLDEKGFPDFNSELNRSSDNLEYVTFYLGEILKSQPQLNFIIFIATYKASCRLPTDDPEVRFTLNYIQG